MGCTSSKSGGDSAFESNIDEVTAPKAVPAKSADAAKVENVPTIIDKISKDSVTVAQPVIEAVQPDKTWDLSKEPLKKFGHHLKEGHVVKNWKKRFFVLEKGHLAYFVDVDKRGVGSEEKGRLRLNEYMLIQGFSGKSQKAILLSHKTDNTKDFLFECGVDEDRMEWESAIKDHIDYATALVQQRTQENFDVIGQ